MSTADPSAALPRRVAVTGSSGLIGSALVPRLRSEGAEVLRLVRRPPQAADEARWDPDAGSIDAAALEGVDAVVHLSGEEVAERWTEEKKRRIRASRVESTRLVASTLAGLARKPRVLVAASAVGIYGNRGEEVLTEESAPGGGFLAGVVREWEAAAEPAKSAGIRVVHVRLGLVLAAAGGALARLLTPFRLGVGGQVGNGLQWMPWITRHDAVEVFLRALRDESLRGVVNAVAGASTNSDFTHTLARALHRPALVPVPAFGLHLLFGREMPDETILASQRVDPRRLRDLGFAFHHPDLVSAVRAALDDKEM